MTHKPDNFPHFRFRLKVGDRPVAGFMDITGASPGGGQLEPDVGSVSLSLESTHHESLSMKWGLIYEQDFEDWSSAVDEPGIPSRDIQVDRLDETGSTVESFGLFACRPIGIVAVPRANPGVSMVAVEVLVLTCKEWHRV